MLSFLVASKLLCIVIYESLFFRYFTDGGQDER
jgi:hypothetical protein